jgi:hypothetical protein
MAAERKYDGGKSRVVDDLGWVLAVVLPPCQVVLIEL